MYPGVGTFVLIRPTQTFYERINFEQDRQEIEAGDFFIGQMDMRRRVEGQRGSITLGIYRFIALYGESYSRTTLLYLILGMFFSVGYLLAGFEAARGSIHYEGGFKGATAGQLTQDYLQSLILS